MLCTPFLGQASLETLLWRTSADLHVPGIRSIAPPICSHLHKRDDGHIIVLGGLRRAAVLAVISTPRLSSLLKHIILEVRRSIPQTVTCFCNFWVPRSEITDECSSCWVGPVSLAQRVAWNRPSWSWSRTMTGRRPGSSYLSETKHPPDEGYIRHALSYSHYHHPLVLDHHHICSLSASGLR